MSDLFQQESPLVQIELGEPKGSAPRIEEKAFNGYLNLRGKAGHTGFIAAMLKVLGVEAPTDANTVIDAGDNRSYWVSLSRSRTICGPRWMAFTRRWSTTRAA